MTLIRNTLATAVATALMLTSLAAHADKKADVQKILTLQQPALEDMARSVAERPALQMAASVRQIMAQAVPDDKREATAKQIDAEIKKYLDAAVPAVRASATKLSQSTLAPLLEEKFTEDELKDLVAMLDSPVLKKYQGLLPEMSNTMLEKVVADARPQVQPKLQTAETNIRNILDKATGGKLSGNGEAKPAAKPASKK
ncbi:hypothetical protein WNB94_04520 [Aquabacterium sp. A3]|uniref:hypothetical protein n=1 Tax=Aquabacterium sp. A3 TaxID=3132829 RepID=UPI00311A4342